MTNESRDQATAGGPPDGPSMACVELVELVTDYFEGALSPSETHRLELHLADCDGCETYLEQMRETIAAASGLSPDAAPAPLREKLLAAFRADRSEESDPGVIKP